MKKAMKFIAIILAVVLALSCFCTAFAGLENGKKIDLGLISIELGKIDLKINGITKEIDLENLTGSPIVGFTKSFNAAFGDAFATLGNDLGEKLAGLIELDNILNGLKELGSFLGLIKTKP